MLRKYWFLFFVLLVEGASLMAVEIIGAKLLTPFYGSSLYVWTAVLSITLFGLTLGYFFGGQLARKQTNRKQLILILAISAMLVFALPVSAKTLIHLTSSMPLIWGICIASFLLLVPPMICFGMVGPIVVRLMAQKKETLGNIAGVVYFTSTIGGIASTFLFGFYWIPELGLKFSALTIAIALMLLPLVYFIIKILSTNKEAILYFDVQHEQAVKARFISNIKTPSSKVWMIKKSAYLFAALEGAVVMMIELMAARMLAPYFGSSLFVWVAVIGITLISLALGYLIGGRLADKHTSKSTIYWVLLIASVFLMFMHYSSQQFTHAFTDIDVRLSLVLVSLLFILPPLVFMGMIPTLLIRLLTEKIDAAGMITGRVFTISSASGIIALLIMGFIIIPKFGLTMPSILIGLCVGLIPFVKLLTQRKYISLLFIVFGLMSFSQRNNASSSPDVKVLSYSEGLLGQLMVADLLKSRTGGQSNDRVLLVNRMGQTYVDRENKSAKMNYAIFASAVASALPENSEVLVLGLGGGAVANIFHNLKFNVDAVELDNRIAKVSKEYFGLKPAVKVFIDGARHYLETTDKRYDLILFDVFKGDESPAHVLSLECFKRARSLLNKDGLVIVNFDGFLSENIGKPGRSVYATLAAAGFNVRILPTPGTEEERNLLFVATSETRNFQHVRSPLRHKGKAVNLETLFLNTKSIDLSNAIVFTDDKPILDKINIEANEKWRKGYNKTITRFFMDNGVQLFK